jgi:hypothetical protein
MRGFISGILGVALVIGVLVVMASLWGLFLRVVYAVAGWGAC